MTWSLHSPQQIIYSSNLFKEGVGSDVLSSRNFIGEVIKVLEEIFELTLSLSTVTTPNLSQIRSARYAFHHNPRIIVVIHIT
jgi:hypothetical protein